MKYLLFLLCLSAPIYAQDISIENLPDRFRFTDRGHDGNTSVIYLGQDETGHKFHYVRDDSADDPDEYFSWANDASQLIRWQTQDELVSIAPHDCWPKLGTCHFTITHEDGSKTDFRANMYVKDGIWFHERYVVVGDEALFFERACTRMDEYGFPIDYYGEYWDGEVAWSERTSTMDIPDPRSNLDELIKLCEAQPDMIS